MSKTNWIAKEIILHAFLIGLESHSFRASMWCDSNYRNLEIEKKCFVIYLQIIRSRFPWLRSYVQRVPHNGDVIILVIIPDCIVKRGIWDRISKNESHTERNNLPTGSLNQYNTFSLTFVIFEIHFWIWYRSNKKS